MKHLLNNLTEEEKNSIRKQHTGGMKVMTEEDLNKIVRRVINENDRVYGGSDIKNLYNKLKDDEYVHLDDSSGDLSGEVVSKIEYVKRMLKSAIREENWSKVGNTILFIDSMIKH